MRATKRGSARYHAVSAVWGLPEKRRTQDETVAWGKRHQTTRASLYAETAIRKMRTPTIDWDGPNSNGGIDWI
jgi:hypothetical protein